MPTCSNAHWTRPQAPVDRLDRPTHALHSAPMIPDPTQSPFWIEPQRFLLAVDTLPLVSIDLCITNPGGQLLLGLRRNRPAQSCWFTPGGRIRKNERFAQAQVRIGADEFGLPAAAWSRAQAMGIHDHLYPDCAVSTDVSTHYVNHPYWIALDADEVAQLRLQEDDQHHDWRWQDARAAASDAGVHAYAQVYARWVADAMTAAAAVAQAQALRQVP